MNIIKPAYKWNGTLIPLDLSKVTHIVIHHTASITASVDTVHAWHKQNGWAGIGYNFYVRKDGTVYEGRGLNIGAHVAGRNSKSIGICVEGDYDKEYDVSPTMLTGLYDTINHVAALLPNKVAIEPHLFFGGTECCGRFLASKMDLIREGAEVFKVVDRLVAKGIISSPDYWKVNLVASNVVSSDYVKKLLIKIGKVV